MKWPRNHRGNRRRLKAGEWWSGSYERSIPGWTAHTALDVTATEPVEVEVERRAEPLPEPGPAPFLVIDAGAAGRIVDWVALGWGREPTSPPR